ncbi:MAG TPA: hypothetical protein VLB87_03540 [Pyrinomonadaceae bacterium]|nr:hypothetical protein [Pyrinomonadaceae bacterium]
MKRCPECLFIYPETDLRCDFDNTALVVVDDAELEAATKAPASSTAKKSKRTSKRPQREAKSATGTSKKSRRKVTTILPVVALVIGLVGFFVYYGLSSRNQSSVEPASVASVMAEPVTQQPPHVVVAPAATETASPSPGPSVTPKETSDRVATSHSRTTVAPVSTSGPGMGKKLGGKPVIVLTSGGKIDADEVWRTRDGVWYRRNGIVTLVKHNRVKAISNQ